MKSNAILSKIQAAYSDEIQFMQNKMTMEISANQAVDFHEIKFKNFTIQEAKSEEFKCEYSKIQAT